MEKADMLFDKVISLGLSCETAFQIREVIDQEEAYVFDWLIARGNSVARAFRTDFQEIAQPIGLSLAGLVDADHPFIADSVTGLEYHHDFPAQPDFLDALDDVQNKYRFLINRMRALLESDATILFVQSQATPDVTRDLDTAIAARFPRLRYKLLGLSIGHGLAGGDEGDVSFRLLPGRGATWQERTHEWRGALMEFIAPSMGRTLRAREPSLQTP